MPIHTLTCSACDFNKHFPADTDAEAPAIEHARQPGHIVTCTRPAHHSPGSIPVIVFTSHAGTEHPIQ